MLISLYVDGRSSSELLAGVVRTKGIPRCVPTLKGIKEGKYRYCCLFDSHFEKTQQILTLQLKKSPARLGKRRFLQLKMK
ncbi:hypothetical protein VCO01S_05120 [Vibrio comitans NBRC 102076]|uniref:Uncharacterized protein n=1 Tax=Vibrio comitans NBRC 102076 TaxID=1219078 RepID=A0A4Y3IIH6_9VIBR|nr:hypothetical protein VCO01S_05120 [Vibrio comitans NBRC 102076]